VRTDSLCPASGAVRQLRAGEHRAVTVGGRSGQYRTVILDCAATGYVVQQWVFTDEPGVVLVRWHGGRVPADDQLVRTMVDGATLPAGTGGRLDDFGLITGYQRTAAGVTVTFDRAVPRSLWTPNDVNGNPQTYRLPLAPNVAIRSALTLCGDPALSTGPDGLAATPCSLSTLTARLDQAATAPVVRATHVWIRYDQSGRVISITEDYRP
jgi:hypothetical protein